MSERQPRTTDDAEDAIRSEWRRAVSEADDDTLIYMRKHQQEQADRYQRTADIYQWRADTITTELGRRAYAGVCRD